MTETRDVALFDRSSPVFAYWLPNCEGFRVRAGRRTGVVRAVELDHTGDVARLVVSFGLGRRAAVAPETVEAVVPAQETIVLVGAPGARRRPRLVPAAERAVASLRYGVATTRQAARRVRVARSRAAGDALKRGWAVTARGWRGAAHGRDAARRWLEPRLVALGRAVSRAADAGSIGLVRLVVAIGARIRDDARPAVGALGSRGSAVLGRRRRPLARPSTRRDARRPKERPERDARERAV